MKLSRFDMSPYNTKDRIDLEYISYINYIIGGIQMITVIFIMFIQILIFILFYKNSEMTKSMPFKLMRHLGITEIIQQVGHLISSFYSLFYDTPQNIFGTFIASILQTGYVCSIVFLFLLTLNRFDVIFNRTFLSSINRDKFFNVMIIINYLWGIILVIFFMLKEFRLYYSLYDYAWQYEAVDPSWKIAQTFENRFVISVLLICFIFYIIIIGKIMYLRSYSSSGSLFSFTDLNLLLQGVLNFLVLVFLELCWAILYKVLPSSKYTYTVINYVYILSSGINSILGIIFIRDIRIGIINMLCIGKNGRSTAEVKTIKIVTNKTQVN
uniref:G_PROTEIN_RECEP_F1_2 domain-containing protein n=1 Tax=Parastrongyloides trichosuri TaxID=131310 RepID=A0A0N4ZX90_PARTI